MSELADATQSSRSRLSHAVARLEAQGWVRRDRHPSDRRGAIAVLTDEGFAALEAAAPGHVESVRRHLFDQLSPAQLASLRDISDTLLGHLLPLARSRGDQRAPMLDEERSRARERQRRGVMTGRTIVIMGPAGSGKSTVGPLIASRLGLTFVDADDYHDAASIASMRSGVGLDDRQRIPWLHRLNHELRARRDAGTVLACSALRPEYRAILGDGIDHPIFVYLSVREGTLHARLGGRTDHFAGPDLLPSQLVTLDLGDDTITVDGEQPPAAVADAVVAILTSPRGGKD